MGKPEADPYFIPDEEEIAALQWWSSPQDETVVDDNSIPHHAPDDVPF
jgi:hypothetical protein